MIWPIGGSWHLITAHFSNQMLSLHLAAFNLNDMGEAWKYI